MSNPAVIALNASAAACGNTTTNMRLRRASSLARRFWAIAAGALIASMAFGAQAASVRAWLDRDTMQIGETVTLNVEVSASATADEPDFSALSQDFRLLGSQSSREFNMSNGITTSKTLWAMGLEPLREGVLTIPALDVGGSRTEPMQLTVLPATAQSNVPGDAEVYLEVEAEPRNPYVQEEVRLTVKLFVATTLTEGQLSEPEAGGFAVERLGQDRNYFANAGGRRYQVIERRYAMTPERSGPLVIGALRFAGRALDGGGGFFGRGRQLSARSTPIDVQVRPRPPESGAGAWLPAQALELSETYGNEPLVARVGEPLTRTVTIRAQGLGQAQLPNPEMPAPDGAQVYPDQPETGNRHSENSLVGERRVRYAIVPNQPGKLRLPEIRLPWWDLSKDQPAVAILAAREINVLPAEGVASATATPASTAAPGNATPAVPESGARPPIPGGVAAWWRPLAMALGLAWLITLGFWLRARKGRPVLAKIAASAEDPSARAARAEFARASAGGDPRGMARALLAWARAEKPALRCRNLVELGAQLGDPAQRAALAGLDRALYGAATSATETARLGALFRERLHWADASQPTPGDAALPPLWNI